jgi:hypothetical protein
LLAHRRGGDEHRCMNAMNSPRTTATTLMLLLAILLANVAWSRDHAYRPPRLSNGQVDLQGTWALINVTPLERPPQFKTLVLTATDAARIEAARMARLEDRAVITTGSEFYDALHPEPIRGELHSSIIVDPADGLIPGNRLFHQKRDARRAALFTAFDGPEQRPTSERCLQQFNSAVPILVNANKSFHQIIQVANTVVIATESMHEARIIRLDSQHNPPAMVTWLGDSIGRWEGETLVVETTYFTASSESRASGPNVVLVSPQTIVVERFTRIADDALHYAFTVTDPTFYTQSWTGENQFARSAERLYEHACHEGNYSLKYILQGARAQEQSDYGPPSRP